LYVADEYTGGLVVETGENAEKNERCHQVSSVATADNKDGKYFNYL